MTTTKKSERNKKAAKKIAAIKSKKTATKSPVKPKPAPKAKAVVKAKPAVKAKTAPKVKAAPKAKASPRLKAVPAKKEARREVRTALVVSPKGKKARQVKQNVMAKKAVPQKTRPPVPAAAKPAQSKRVAATVKPTPKTAPPVKSAPSPVTVNPSPKSKVKVLSREFLIEIANTIRTAVLPFARDCRGREIIGTATSGDPTFELDRIAEKALLMFLKNARLPVAYYSENAGYTTFTNAQPQNLLIVDPIDGTRAAKNGFEGCVIAIASTRVIERPCMADIDNACVMELMGNRTFYAERRKGLRITQDNHVKRIKPVKDLPLELISWSMTVPARPAQLIFPTAAKLIDISALKGGFFPCNSTSYSLTRLVTNQLDACVDIANRFYRDIPYLVKDFFINAGRGTVIGIAPYDLAASLLIAQEGGCTVTDAYGKKFDDVLLLDTSVENQRSMIAAFDPELHEKLLIFFEKSIHHMEQALRRRAERAAVYKAAHTGRAPAKG